MNRLAVTRMLVFAVTAVAGAVVTFGAVLLTTNRGPISGALEAQSYLLARDVGEAAAGGEPVEPVGFEIATDPAGPAQALPTLAPELVIGLAAAADPGTAVDWLNPSGFPRVQPISQFDGGPFQGANCTLASGAMLARLGFGIVTTGSVLRTLQDDQEGGTGLDDLATALWRGYGVTFSAGAVTPNQLQKLLGAGYGAVVVGDYVHVPPNLSLQRGFSGAHAIFVDGFFPGNATVGPAYYVIDPLARPHSGYLGAWWPAPVLDTFAAALGSDGRIYGAWVRPPGGEAPPVVIPDIPPLPSPRPAASVAPGVTPSPGASPAASPGLPPEPGDKPAAPPPVFDPGLPAARVGLMLDPLLAMCVVGPPPPDCPPGVPAVYGRAIGLPAVAGKPAVEALWVAVARPNEVLVGFRAPPGAGANVSYWLAGELAGVLHHPTSIVEATVGGEPVRVARLSVLAGATYYFQVAADVGGVVEQGTVGEFTTGAGVSRFDVAPERIVSPRYATGPLLTPFARPGEGTWAPVLVGCQTATGGGGTRLSCAPTPGALGPGGPSMIGCGEIIGSGGRQFCLEPVATVRLPQPDSCRAVRVTYELRELDHAGVVLRAVPSRPALLLGGLLADTSVIEADGPAGGGSVTIGCLTPGLRYVLTIDAVGDANGILTSVPITVAE